MGKHRLLNTYHASHDVRVMASDGSLFRTGTPIHTIARVDRTIDVGASWDEGDE